MTSPNAPQTLRRLALTLAAAAALAATPAAAQIPAPPGAGAPPPSSLQPPTAPAPPAAQAVTPGPAAEVPGEAPAPAAPAEAPAEPAAPAVQQPAAPAAPAARTASPRPSVELRKAQARARLACRPQPRRASAARKQAARRRCAAARRAAARLVLARPDAPSAGLRAVGGSFGGAVCTTDNGISLFQQPPSVGSDRLEWIEHWNAFAYNAGGTMDAPQEWVGPFFSRPDYPGWFWYQGVWTHSNEWGGWSQHSPGLVLAGGAQATGVQWIKWHGSGVVDSRYTATTGCEGHRGWFAGT